MHTLKHMRRPGYEASNIDLLANNNSYVSINCMCDFLSMFTLDHYFQLEHVL